MKKTEIERLVADAVMSMRVGIISDIERARSDAVAEALSESDLIQELPIVEELQMEYPFGKYYNFGVQFSEDDIVVHAGVIYHAGMAIEWGGPVYADDPSPTVTGLSDWDVVCIVYTIATGVVSIGVRDPIYDYGGEIIRALCKVRVVRGIASLAKWYGGGVECRVVGGAS